MGGKAPTDLRIGLSALKSEEAYSQGLFQKLLLLSPMAVFDIDLEF
ncbi:hypothetical protein F3D3_2636 [Fusibacter sp. 3D3]|nr:hypothetical protein F3D3_2636 [Fusibacter sp. 3D3]